ncbi:C2 domain containing protein [Trichomonas vaginalis G3]|uniref:C2 domain containing protein n=1 Tax=Trichomonas vaginalis (strain ATCC PRA-98 / G3) TaxID=412133 RepID=A2FNL5_TRIV3|nr:C2 domain-containing protein [Trichomonas vaginalis G3]EAX93515.1 C2 domain containing protein [Trichomonas vaginalis G3]KAI5511588.1 C2 domain-containing protein [Trichomonas vaginalis G3]|eukprot:XP_001306445.1 C2 domain containing protein [Trichomonas vaginalis G3]
MLHFSVVNCRGLPDKNSDGKLNTYVQVEVRDGDNKLRLNKDTQVVEKSLNPEYPTEYFSVLKNECSSIKFSVMEEDGIEPVCFLKLKLFSLLPKMGKILTREMLVSNP